MRMPSSRCFAPARSRTRTMLVTLGPLTVLLSLGCLGPPRYSPIAGAGGEARPAREVLPTVRAGSEIAITFARPTSLIGARAPEAEPERLLERATRISGYVLGVTGDTVTLRSRHVFANGRNEELVPALVFRVAVDSSDSILAANPNAAQRVSGPLLYVGALVAVVAGVLAIAALGGN